LERPDSVAALLRLPISLGTSFQLTGTDVANLNYKTDITMFRMQISMQVLSRLKLFTYHEVRCNHSGIRYVAEERSPSLVDLIGGDSTTKQILQKSFDPGPYLSAYQLYRPVIIAYPSRMTESLAEGTKGEVWMLDTFGNVHSLVNACQQLGFKVHRITSASQLQSAKVTPALRPWLIVESPLLWRG